MCSALSLLQPRSAFGFTFEVFDSKAFQFVSINSKWERITRIEKSLFFNISECVIYVMVFAGILEFGIQGMECLGIGIRKCVEFCVQFRQ